MNKENDNAVGRLGSKSNEQRGSERVYSMSEEAGQTEPSSSEREETAERLLYNHAATVATLGAAFFGTIIISIIISRMWDEDEIRLHILNFCINLLQTIARLCGGWALQLEHTYNEYVKALH